MDTGWLEKRNDKKQFLSSFYRLMKLKVQLKFKLTRTQFSDNVYIHIRFDRCDVMLRKAWFTDKLARFTPATDWLICSHMVQKLLRANDFLKIRKEKKKFITWICWPAGIITFSKGESSEWSHYFPNALFLLSQLILINFKTFDSAECQTNIYPVVKIWVINLNCSTCWISSWIQVYHWRCNNFWDIFIMLNCCSQHNCLVLYLIVLKFVLFCVWYWTYEKMIARTSIGSFKTRTK